MKYIKKKKFTSKTGRVTPQNNYDLVRYLLTGTPSPQSKNGR